MTARKCRPQGWLVYEKGESYDGGDTPLLLVATQGLAAQAQADIQQVVEGVRSRLQRLPDPFEDGIDDDEYAARIGKRDRMLKRVRWPHGLKRESWAWNFVVGVMPLPFIQEAD